MRTSAFATGIEASCRRVLLPGGRCVLVDEYGRSGHYRRWRAIVSTSSLPLELGH